MPTIISRAAAGLPPVPSSIGYRSLGSWRGITAHHTGGPFSSWRAIHDWQTSGRPPAEQLAYTGYSFGIANGQVTELTGWDRHPAGDHENSRLQVVFGGNYHSVLPSQADLAAFVWFVGEAERRCGKQLPVIPHSGVWPSGHQYATSCPGDKLRAWVTGGMPRPGGSPAPSTEEDDMLHGQVPTGQQMIIVSTPWDESRISFGCDMGKAKLRVAEHLVGTDQWFITEIVVTDKDKTRKDLPKRANIDRRSIVRVPIDDSDKLDTPVGYLAWLV